MTTVRHAAVSVRVPAKINLDLAVGPVSGDGFHPVHTVFHAVSLYDDLTVAPTEADGELELVVDGEHVEGVPLDGTNLAVRAARLLADRTGVRVGARMTLTKGIPVAGGMAGGSADAAAALLGCDLAWRTGLPKQDLLEMAGELGSDVAFALVGGTAIGAGRGERITPALARGKYHWVLALSDEGMSTAAVYAEYDRLMKGRPVPHPRVTDSVMQALRRGDSEALGPALRNDLQAAACSLRPALGDLLDVGQEYGALGGVVSGSGPTVAFLVRDHEHALDLSVALTASGACQEVRRAHGPVHGARASDAPAGVSAVPTNLVNLERVRLALGTRVLLDGMSLGVAAGERIGVVGRNGGGKSTLLRVLAGAQPVDDGRVTHTGTLRVGLLEQTDVLDPAATVRQCVVGDRADHEWAGDARVRDVVTGLLGGLHAPDVGGLDALVAPLSGGERRRIALAALLVDDPDLLLLDEPTNHLDVEGVDWLARHLSGRRPSSALVAVTHDRWFLDAVGTTTWEVHDGRADAYEGGYAAYVLARAERERVAATTEERRQNLLRKELAWLRRGPPARTSKPRFRIDAANALIADEPPARDDVALVRFATTRLGKDVIDVENATVALGDRVLLDRVTWRLGPGDRFGLVGVNGSGKSTLLRVLAGQEQPVSGRVRRGQTVRLAFLTQEVRELEALSERRVVQAVRDVRETTRLGDREVTASQLAERLGFTGARQQTLVRDLSGGERRRLQLLRLLMDEPNVLLLDEPTNDLDVDTLTALEDLLDGWAGTLVVVSHDRYALERMCDRQLALLGDGRLRDLPGGVEEYLRLRVDGAGRGGAGSAGAGSASGSAGAAASGGSAAGLGAGSDGVGSGPTADPAAQRAARKDMARIERQLGRLSEQEARLHESMAEQAADHVAVAELDVRLRALQAERDDLEAKWLDAAEILG